jgi:hypothetical protein
MTNDASLVKNDAVQAEPKKEQDSSRKTKISMLVKKNSQYDKLQG